VLIANPSSQLGERDYASSPVTRTTATSSDEKIYELWRRGRLFHLSGKGDDAEEHKRTITRRALRR